MHCQKKLQVRIKVINTLAKQLIRIFIGLLGVLSISTSLYCIAGIIYIANIFEAEKQNISHLSSSAMAKIVIVWIFLGFNFFALIFDLKLIYFHIWLIKHKMTTYEYIIMKRQKNIQVNKWISKVFDIFNIDWKKNISTNSKGVIRRFSTWKRKSSSMY